MPFISAQALKNIKSNDGYLKIKKSKVGDTTRFLILSTNDEVVEYWNVWGEDNTGASKPFRFVSEPTDAEIKAEMGPNYERGLNYEKDGVAKPVFTIAAFVWSYEYEKVMVLKLDKSTLIKAIDKISQKSDYANIQDIDLEITFVGKEDGWYSVLPLPRKKECVDEIAQAWAEAKTNGCDLKRLLVNGNPFSDSDA